MSGSDASATDPHACTGACRGHARGERREFSVPPVPVHEREDCRIDGIILAAGKAQRMGHCKAVLPMEEGTGAEGSDGKSILAVAAAAMWQGCNGRIVVVTGFHDALVREEAIRLGLEVAHNFDAQSGMFSSVCTGLRYLLAEDAQAVTKGDQEEISGRGQQAYGIMLLPVDIPLVRPETCALLAEAFATRKAAVTVPVCMGEQGHPPLLRYDTATRVLNHDGRDGLRGALEDAQADGATVCEVSVADSGMLMDVDTPQDYAVARTCFARKALPDDREIAALWHLAETGDAVRAHGACVAEAAVCLARALNSARTASETRKKAGADRGGGNALVDCELVRTAALLHDICKGARRHEESGGLFLTRYGFAQVGAIVAAHRDIDPETVSVLRERELVMLADKLVRGTSLVPVAERYDERLREWAHDAQATEEIGERKQRALALYERLQAELGESPYTVLQRSGECKISSCSSGMRLRKAAAAGQ